jgi:type I site-specific restriction-modification system R (restriction) subunit
MLEHRRLLDLIENFILFDDSKPGATRKVGRVIIRYWASIMRCGRSCGRRS